VSLPDPDPVSTALVTGASAGIGEEIARALARRGHGVTLVARRKERLDAIASQLASEHRIRAEALACDLTDADARDRLAGQIDELGLIVEIVVNNAGFGYSGSFTDADRERQLAMVRVNVESVVDFTGRYLPAMVGRGRGAVINIASTAAFQPLPGTATYGATKAFVLSFSEAVHSELGGTGVSLTAVCPGPVRTEFTQAAGIAAAEENTPGVIWMSAAEVAEQAVDAADKGKRAIVPGKLNYAGSLFGRHSPRVLSLPLAKRLWRQVD
jgi:short-subunit dehydrogenase